MSNRLHFTHDGFSILLLMQVENLPVPMALSWRPAQPGQQGRFHIQVDSGDFRAWLEMISSPVLDSAEYEGETHMYAEGPLARTPATTISLVAVLVSQSEQGRRLASEREDLIAAGVDPAELAIPLDGGDATEPGR